MFQLGKRNFIFFKIEKAGVSVERRKLNETIEVKQRRETKGLIFLYKLVFTKTYTCDIMTISRMTDGHNCVKG